MAATDTNVLKAKKAELADLKDRLVADHLASASIRDLLAPLEGEIALLEEKLEAKDDEKKKDEE